MSSSKQRIDFTPHPLIDPDERRPGAFEVFARQFICGVYARFAADGDFASCVIEHVGRAFVNEAVALRPVLAQRRNNTSLVFIRMRQRWQEQERNQVRHLLDVMAFSVPSGISESPEREGCARSTTQ